MGKKRLQWPLRANIHETPVVFLINEQGEKEKGRDEWHFSWCSFFGGFGWRGTKRRRAKRAAAQWSGSQSGRDRGISMSSKPVAFLLADLGVTKTHSRPHVSNDNPYSDRPEFPDRFGSLCSGWLFRRANSAR
jgi:hypothetical protein